MLKKTVFLSLGLFLFGMAQENPATIWNSQTDFAGWQGNRNWFYMSRAVSETGSATGFAELIYSSGKTRWCSPGDKSPFIFKDRILPGALYDAVRMWKAPLDGNIMIGSASPIRKADAGGNGVQCLLYHNGNELWSHTIEGNDLTGVDFAPLSVKVKKDDELYFVVSARRSSRSDALIWDIVIKYGTSLTPNDLSFNPVNTDLPCYTIIGDSIAGGYQPYLSQLLNNDYLLKPRPGRAEAFKNLDIPRGANSGDSGMVLSYISAQNQNNLLNVDFMILNAGLHDIKTDPSTGERLVPIEQYEKNLREIFSILRSAGVQVVWIRTTPVVDSIHNARIKKFNRHGKDVVAYNAVADRVCAEFGIEPVDLFTFTKEFGDSAYVDHVHYKTDVKEKQARFIEQRLREVLAE